MLANTKFIRISKNRGWRGLAEVICYDTEDKTTTGKIASAIFSFSADVWDDMLKGYVVMQDDTNYYVLHLQDTSALPHGHQRSVLIKNWIGTVTEVNSYAKDSWTSAEGNDYGAINHFRRNKNNHTTSDWNYIGIRVMPTLD